MVQGYRAGSVLSVMGVLLLLGVQQSAGISYPTCADGGSVWVTERPFLSDRFPGANLWFFCVGSFNLAGLAVDACKPGSWDADAESCNSTSVSMACNLMGFDESWEGDLEVTQAEPNEPVLSLDGRFCLRRGNYVKELPEGWETLPGEPCDKIESLACVRTIEKIQEALNSSLAVVDSDDN